MQPNTEDSVADEDTTNDTDLDASDLTPDEKTELIEELEEELSH